MTKTININGKTLALELLPIEHDTETNGAWRNGIVTLADDTRICCGGGWIENEETANEKNEAAGIAGGLRQGVFYPNETVAGDFDPYDFGEDGSGWEDKLMPVLYGPDWKDREDARYQAREVYETIQEAFAILAARSHP